MKHFLIASVGILTAATRFFRPLPGRRTRLPGGPDRLISVLPASTRSWPIPDRADPLRCMT